MYKLAMPDVIAINKGYYNKLYSSNFVSFLIHGIISFDQQSKTKQNVKIANPVIKKIIRNKGLAHVFDYGYGFGTFLLRCPRENCELFGYDLADNARKNLTRIMLLLKRKFVFVDVDTCSFDETEKFDMIICSHVLEHIPEDIDFLKKIIRTLSSNGFMLINVPINETNKDDKHVRFYDREACANILREIGLNMISVSEVDKWSNFLLKIEKKISMNIMTLLIYRLLRVLLALTPIPFLLIGERLFLKNEQPNQLIVLWAKNVE